MDSFYQKLEQLAANPEVERFFALSMDMVCVLDAQGCFLRLSESWSGTLGHGPDDLLRRPFIDLVHPDCVEATLSAFACLHDGGLLNGCATRLRTKDSTWRSISLNASKAADGLIFAVARDITDEMAEHQALSTEQDKLREENDFLGRVMNASRDAIYCVRAGGAFPLVYVNDAACRLLRAGREVILSKELSHFAPALESAVLDDIWQQLQGSELPFLFTTELTYSDGLRVPIEISSSHVRHDGRDYIVGSMRDISIRREVEARLREREALYRAAIEASSDGFWLVDGQGRIVDCNTAYSRMSGYSLAELRAMGINDLGAIEDRGETQACIEQIIRERSCSFETHHRRKDGSQWEVEVTALYSEIEGGRFFVFLRDLRSRRVAEMLLKARLRLSDIGRGGDIDALMTEVLDSAERLTGSRIGFFHFLDPDGETLTLQAWSTNTLTNMCDAEGKGLHYPLSQAGLWADCVRNGQPLVCNDYPNASNQRGMPVGHAPVIRLLAVPIPGETGVQAVIGVGNKAEDYGPDDVEMVRELATLAMDIVNGLRAQTAQRTLAAALAATAREWSAAMDSFKDGVAILDADGCLVRANSAFFALTRSDPERRLGKRMTGLPDVEAMIGGCPVGAALVAAEPWHAILELDAPGNPSDVPLEVRLTRIGDGEGERQSLLLSLYDLSETREREEQMRLTIRELANSNAELERFAQVAAHDLQEPTRRQVIYAQLLQRLLAGQLDEEKTRYFGYIMEGALRMRDMVRELRTYAEDRHAPRANDVANLDLVLEEVRQSLYSEIEAARAKIRAGQLGAASASRHRMKLLLTHIVGNALKFRRPGLQIEIEISATRSAGWLEVVIADNGIGIPESKREDLFVLFRRLHNTGDIPGLGMGLAQCRHIVESLGGRIWLDGNEQGGTTVRFTLPRPG